MDDLRFEDYRLKINPQSVANAKGIIDRLGIIVDAEIATGTNTARVPRIIPGRAEPPNAATVIIIGKYALYSLSPATLLHTHQKID